MAYEHLGRGALDYYPCRYGRSKLLFRGPRRKLDKPYCAVIGGSETYGKFLETPYPTMLEQLIQMPVVNLGCQNAGNEVFAQDTTVTDICSAAEVTIIQLMGAQNLSNRFYSVHPRRNDRFIKASGFLHTVFREVDFTEFHFNRHMLGCLNEISPEKFSLVRDELKEAWVARMKLLMSRIEGRVILLWLSAHTPDDTAKSNDLNSDPAFVDRDMINRVSEQASDVVEVVATQSEIDAGRDRMAFNALEEIMASEMLGPIAHETAAWRLQKILPRVH
ncbi:MAG: hypothetical protein KUG58_08405 [Marinosulfonomonas sp.]|nr:hypothetical protein [Marinosulfonomonas sp.]